MTRVVDANLVVYALLDNTNRERAYAELRKEPAIAPDFLLVETTYVFAKYVRAGALQIEEAKAHSKSIPTVIELVPQGSLILPTIDLSFTGSHSVYDCLYLALALNGSNRLLTADKRLAKFASEMGCDVTLFE